MLYKNDLSVTCNLSIKCVILIDSNKVTRYSTINHFMPASALLPRQEPYTLMFQHTQNMHVTPSYSGHQMWYDQVPSKTALCPNSS